MAVTHHHDFMYDGDDEHHMQLALEMSKVQYNDLLVKKYLSPTVDITNTTKSATRKQLNKLKYTVYNPPTNSLPIIIIDDEEDNTNNNKKEENNTCYICLDPYKRRRKIIKLDCNHQFHPICIKTWLKFNASCPKCKQKLL